MKSTKPLSTFCSTLCKVLQKSFARLHDSPHAAKQIHSTWEKFFAPPCTCNAMRSPQGLRRSWQGTKKKGLVGIGPGGQPCNVTVGPHGGPPMERGRD